MEELSHFSRVISFVYHWHICIVSGVHFLLLVLKFLRFLEFFGIDHTHVRVCVSVESTIVGFFDLCGRLL